MKGDVLGSLVEFDKAIQLDPRQKACELLKWVPVSTQYYRELTSHLLLHQIFGKGGCLCIISIGNCFPKLLYFEHT